MIVVIMGVCGSGKTTIGETLARKLGWSFRDADEFHPVSNKTKMSAGLSLTDQDRYPWLVRIHEYIARVYRENKSTVVTCSALKHEYRSIIIGEHEETHPEPSYPCPYDANTHVQASPATQSRTYRMNPDIDRDSILFVYLKGDLSVLRERMNSREKHFMPVSLLQSQLDTLEEPRAEETYIKVNIDQAVNEIVLEIIDNLVNKYAVKL